MIIINRNLTNGACGALDENMQENSWASLLVLMCFCQNGYACFCGQLYNKYGSASESDCNATCSGNSAEKCGAPQRNSVYWGKIIIIYQFGCHLWCVIFVFCFVIYCLQKIEQWQKKKLVSAEGLSANCGSPSWEEADMWKCAFSGGLATMFYDRMEICWKWIRRTTWSFNRK